MGTCWNLWMRSSTRTISSCSKFWRYSSLQDLICLLLTNSLSIKKNGILSRISKILVKKTGSLSSFSLECSHSFLCNQRLFSKASSLPLVTLINLTLISLCSVLTLRIQSCWCDHCSNLSCTDFIDRREAQSPSTTRHFRCWPSRSKTITYLAMFSSRSVSLFTRTPNSKMLGNSISNSSLRNLMKACPWRLNFGRRCTKSLTLSQRENFCQLSSKTKLEMLMSFSSLN